MSSETPELGTNTLVLHPYEASPAERRLRTPEESLAEAVALAGAISLNVVAGELVRLNAINPATLIGGGAVEKYQAVIKEQQIKLVVVDHPLSPVQQRNLEKDLEAKVIDRTGLILEIFGERAQTREGQLQVELASLSFQRSRLVRSWTHLERQRGGFGFIGGPGESQIEIDRRLIDDRIIRIKKDLEKVKQTRSLQRQARLRAEHALVVLVGYTNAGKSTLFNRLTSADVLAKDMLFATLDPTMRQLKLPSGRVVVLSDTVGFISDLPTQLVAAFRATLEEIRHADIILHVRDCASPESEAQKEDVEETLRAMKIDTEADQRLVEVLNKADLLPEGELPNARSDAMAVSALTGQGIPELLKAIDIKLNAGREMLELRVLPHQGEVLAWLHAHGQIMDRVDGEEAIELKVALSRADVGRFHARFAEFAN